MNGQRYSQIITQYQVQNIFSWIHNQDFQLIKLEMTSPGKYLIIYVYTQELYF